MAQLRTTLLERWGQKLGQPVGQSARSKDLVKGFSQRVDQSFSRVDKGQIQGLMVGSKSWIKWAWSKSNWVGQIQRPKGWTLSWADNWSRAKDKWWTTLLAKEMRHKPSKGGQRTGQEMGKS